MPAYGRAGEGRVGTGCTALTILLAAAALAIPASAAAAPVVGSDTVHSRSDTNLAGSAEAFKAVASASTAVNRLNLYLDASSTAEKAEVGLYDGTSKPDTKLGGCAIAAPKAGWNSCALPSTVRVAKDKTYWTAVLLPRSARGAIRFRDLTSNGAVSYNSSSSSLSSLPDSYRPGTKWPSAPASIYADSALGSQGQGALPIPPLDSDGDGIPDLVDQCPTQSGPAPSGCPATPPPPPDRDNDGVPDSSDQCPSEAGPASNKGCPVPPPDRDNDGVPDSSDQCPTQAGPASNNGCPVPPPDRDNDGVPDSSDQCPTQAGPASNNGCPVPPPDRDNDGVPDSTDQCPTQAGPASNNGCPVPPPPPADRDNDGVPDSTDQCPTQAGPASNNGCPVPPPPPADRDNDGVPDSSDQCPTQAGPASNNGCPVPPPSNGKNCMPTPSACGFPDMTNTGVKPGVARQAVSGTVTLSTPGQVYENKTVTGSIVVTASNVTIRNVKVISRAYWAISSRKQNGNPTNLRIEDTEIDMGGDVDAYGIIEDNYTAVRTLIHNGSDCAHLGTNATIRDSFCSVGPDTDNDGWADSTGFCSGPEHFDGYSSDGGSNQVMDHNTIRNPCSQTSAILMSTNSAPITDVTITNNLLAGGGYTLYCAATQGGVGGTETVTGNRIAKTYRPQGGYYGPVAYCSSADTFSGNVWDDSGQAISG